ncbi:MAG: hypothetical protein A3I11_00885 [Elusimicrobia bacterium RIFCSPLOWO2_02_FULL_39_32]|nr:MAG: hypothetical protein A2034_00695 [Elusimicrobia bacterium GWA2_38_7]OGR78997.1 MAG: hypothetical protein A3B80_07910 [Elusimicrobia bacterium RIFCSPHIGHO2_02_FULL_39_36]OGR92581.1 MAG: hypothetical protein A3I11_00885 [Elusimicrobia bacterium RIFCSPLOWO2_02_FULL_39_32]OGR99229.1 MAG: hypothetical protein A3G85_06095 [Elusimicrobia bacterium RIFCSPLOWO2_12_FULL_39_28]
MTLSRLAKKEIIVRVEHGVYTKHMDWMAHPLKKYIVACTLYPEAVVCGVSALTYYDLTDAEECQVWIALPAPKIIHNALYRVIRPTGFSYTLGIEHHTFGKRTVRIYDLEKTVVDAFKYHTEEVALKALKRYLKKKNKNIQKLCSYARKLKKPLDEIISVLMADE